MFHPYFRSFVLGGLFLMFLLTFAASAHAATYYVATSGSDSNPCSQAASCLTIAKGISVLSAGDTLYIRQGTYNEWIGNNWQQTQHLPSGTSWSNPVTIAGYPGERVVVIGGIGLPNNNGTDSSTWDIVSYLIFDNLILDGSNRDVPLFLGPQNHHIRFQNGEVKNAMSMNVQGSAYNVEILNSRIHDAGYGPNGCMNNTSTTQQYRCYGFYFGGHDSLFDGNEVYHNSSYGYHIFTSGHSDVSNNVFRNNIIHNNGHLDVNGQPSYPAPGLLLASGSNNQAYNNIIYGNVEGIDIAYTNGGSNNQVYNNTVYGNINSGISFGSGDQNSVIKNNIIYNNGTAIVDWSNGATGAVISNNLTSDPQFINPPSDFHLQSGSPAKTASDSGGEVGAYANGGGPGTGSGGTTPTPQPTPQGTLCSTLTPGTVIGQGFGTPWNVFNVGEMLIKAFCTATQITAQLGPSTYIYHQGYGWTNNQWVQTTFTCTQGSKVSNAWCPTQAQGTLPQNSSYYVGYTCNWTGSTWRCGCADTQCAQNFWQLQKIN